jgi:hypothetical protein
VPEQRLMSPEIRLWRRRSYGTVSGKLPNPLHPVWMYRIGLGIRNSGIRTRILAFGVAWNFIPEFVPNSMEELPNSIPGQSRFRPPKVRNWLETSEPIRPQAMQIRLWPLTRSTGDS